LIDYVDDVGRILAPVAYLYMLVRWGVTVRWWAYWDTRALFSLFLGITLVSWWSLAVAAHWIPSGTSAVAAVVWVYLSVVSLFLVFGYEIERAKARHPVLTPPE
jgi:FlaA1/EpsC-like NDP-sugar epimerase